MRHVRVFGVVAAFFSAVATGCGGGGHGFRVPSDPIVITNNSLPTTLSGQEVNYLIPFTGGAGGPYALDVIAGALPQGIGTDDATVALVGRPLIDGVFDFTLQLTDSGSDPFSTTTMSYHWVINKGSLVFITDANLPSYVYNRFDAIPLVIAGGTPPYQCQVVDQPVSTPTDEPLPAGLSIPNGSCTIVGAPTGVKAVAPFVYHVSIQASDHADIPGFPTPETVVKIFTLTVLVPDVVITSTSVKNGIVGTPYSDKVEVVDGIPPFTHSIVNALNSTTRMKSQPGHPTDAAPYDSPPGTSPLGYPDPAVSGPYPGKVPEGFFIRESTGDLGGVPRRVGTFPSWIYYVQSNVLPAVPGQNKWKSFSFTMADDVPPNLVLDTSVLQPGSTFAGPPNFLPSMEFGVAYNKQFLCIGGVAADGRWDSPHETLANMATTEVAGSYNFTGTVLLGAFNPPPGVSWNPTIGRLFGTPTGGRGGLRQMNLLANDYKLPTSPFVGHSVTGTCQYDVGPDWVVITETSNGSTSAFFDNSMDFNSQNVEIFEASNGFPTVRNLDNTKDMALTHTHPLGGTLTGSLTSIDFLLTTVNPTWWAYDVYNLNSRSARAEQHTDPQRRCQMAAPYAGDVNMKINFCGGTGGGDFAGYEHPANPAIELPTIAPSVMTHDPTNGKYADGGLLYCYDKTAEFGFFIVRKDSKIQIPVAFNKSTSGFAGFGDAWITSNASASQMMRSPQITVSPDGRFAAAKLKVSVDNFAETQGTTERIVVFCLSGEKPFGGATFAVINPGGTGGTTDGQYLYADSMALTNRYLYFLKGNNIGTNATSGDRVIYGEHWVYRVEFLASSTASLLASSFGGIGGWTNASSSPISTTFHRWMTPGTFSINTQRGGRAHPGTGSSFGGTFETSDGTDAFTNTSPSAASPDLFAYNFANFGPNSMAPTPFRVNASGNACAIVAGANQPAPPSASFLNYSIYVDYDPGTGAIFHEASNAVRRFKGPTRNGGLHMGEIYNRLYGVWDGPATQLEISDDGKKIAVVYNSNTSSWSNLMINNAGIAGFREELQTIVATDPASDPWNNKTNSVITSGVFTGGLVWRMGNLAFTRDGGAIVFWAGYPTQSPTTASLVDDVVSLTGSMYAYTFASSLLEGIQPSSIGGHVDISGTSKTYNTTTQNNLIATNFSAQQGAVQPVGAFYSNDGNFYFVDSIEALTTSSTESHRLVGINVKDTATTLNGRVPLRAFAPSFPAVYGFGDGVGYYYYPNIWLRGSTGSSGSQVGTHASAGSTAGVVFWQSDRPQNTSGTTNDTLSTSFTGGGPANPTAWQDYGSFGGEVFAMRSDVGGNVVQLTNLGAQSTGSVGRTITYLQPRYDGTSIAFQQAEMQSTFTYDHGANKEQIKIITNIAFTAGGVLSGVPPIVTLEGTNGRASASMAIDSSGLRVYYGFTTGGNENNMVLTEKTLNSTGTAVASTRTQNGISAGQARFAVLWSGR